MISPDDRPTRLPLAMRANVTSEELLVLMSRLEGAESERDALREQVRTLREGAQAACQFLIRTNLCPSDTLSALAELRAALASTEAEVKP